MLGTSSRFSGESSSQYSFLPGPGDYILKSTFDSVSKSESRKTSFGASARKTFNEYKEKELVPPSTRYSPYKHDNFGNGKNKIQKLPEKEQVHKGILQDGKHYLDVGPGYYLKQSSLHKPGFSKKQTSFGTSGRSDIVNKYKKQLPAPSDYHANVNRFCNASIGTSGVPNSVHHTGWSRGERFQPTRGSFGPAPGSHNLCKLIEVEIHDNGAKRKQRKRQPSSSFGTDERLSLVDSLRRAGEWTMADIPGPGSYDPKLAMVDQGKSPNIRCDNVKSSSITKQQKLQLQNPMKHPTKDANLRSEDLFRTRPKDVYKIFSKG